MGFQRFILLVVFCFEIARILWNPKCFICTSIEELGSVESVDLVLELKNCRIDVL